MSTGIFYKSPNFFDLAEKCCKELQQCITVVRKLVLQCLNLAPLTP
jgi:hypothetical protein